MLNTLFKGKDRTDIMALALCLFTFSFWSILLSYKFSHFGYFDWDLALFSQGMWDLSHGASYVSLFDANFFSNHANLIAYLVLPIYKIFPHPLTLVLLKVISYEIAAFIIYLLAKERLGPTVAILITWLYLSYTPNVFGLLYEFDFESVAPGILMLILYFYVKDRWLGFLACAVVLVLIKENMPLIIFAFSIHGLFTKKDKIRFGVIPGILALVSFYLLVFVFMPYVSGRHLGEVHPYYIGQNYRDFGGSVGGVLSSIIFHPIRTLLFVMTPLNAGFLFAIFNPLLYLPLGSPGVLFLISPIFAQHLLSASLTEHHIRYAYVMTMAPFLFLATIETLKFLYTKMKKEYYLCLRLLLALNIVILSVNFSMFKDRLILTETPKRTQEMVQDQWKLIHLVPQDASVVASFSFLAPLSQRKYLYAFFKIYDSKYQNDRYSYKLPSNVQYALIDMHDPWLVQEDDFEFAKARTQKFLTSGDWIILKKYGRFILYKRRLV